MGRGAPWNPWLEALEPYTPPRRARVRLDLNESPWPPPPGVVEAVARAAGEANRYPRMEEYLEAVEAVAGYAGVEPGMIVLGLGGDMVIEKAFQLSTAPGARVLLPDPVFAMYRFYAAAHGARVEAVELREEGRRWSLDWGLLLERLRAVEPALVGLDNPNNPTGSLIVPGEAELVELLEEARRRGTLVVLDEAYYEFSRVTYKGLAEAYENLVIVRTLSKAFSLAGLRIGYAVAHPRLAEKLRSLMPPFLPRTSLAAAAAAAREPGYARQTADAIIEERRWLAARLDMMGYTSYETHTNYVLARAPPGTAERLLEEHGIAVKEYRLPGGVTAIRATVGSPGENSALAAALWSLRRGARG